MKLSRLTAVLSAAAMIVSSYIAPNTAAFAANARVGISAAELSEDTGFVTVLEDRFDNNDVSGYEVYAPTESQNAALKAQNGVLVFSEDSGWNPTNGVKKDITSIIKQSGFKSGDKLTVSADITSAWYNNPAKIFIEKNGDKNNQILLAQDGFDGEEFKTDTVTGANTVTFSDSDTLCLCITQPCGTHNYDNIVLTYGEEAPLPTEEPIAAEFKISEPALDEDGAFVTATNTTETDKTVKIHNAKYDGDVLQSVTSSDLTVTAGTRNQRIAVVGAALDTMFVWDGMKPLTKKTTLEQQTWIAGWGSAQQEYQSGDLPKTKLAGSVIRQVVRMSAGGDKMRITLSNAYGNGDLVIGAVHLAKPLGGGAVDTATDTVVTFGGKGIVTIPKGQRVTSDIINYSAEDLEEIMMSIRVDKAPTRITGHSGARATTYIKSGASVSDAAMDGAETNEHWYFASEIDVLKPNDYAAVACLGDSITDGYGSVTNGYTRWTDTLAERVSEAGLKLSVINDGIGGNAINGYGLGENGRDRYEKEIKFRKGLKYLIILEGINDLAKKDADEYGGGPHTPSDGKVTTGIKDAYADIIEAAHAQGVKVIGVPILPCGGSGNDYYKGHPYIETLRNNVNEWIRQDGNFDAVIDMEDWMGDGQTPPCIKAEYNNDGLHPSPAGYKAMGEHIDLSVFNEPYDGGYDKMTAEEYMKNAQNNISEFLPAGAASDIDPAYYGTVESRTYYSNTAGRNTKLNVLLPAGYTPEKKYPVLYMLHGYWENQNRFLESDSDSVHFEKILGNLIASGEAEEMIVVFPYIFCSKDKQSCDGMNLENSLAYDNFVNDLFTDVMPFIEKEYSVKTGRENTAISGFSMGARESLFIGITHSDVFGYIGAACPAPGLVPGSDLSQHPGQIKPESELKTDPAKGKPYLLMITAGGNDTVVYGTPGDYHNILTRNGEPHVWHEVSTGYHGSGSISPHVYNFVRLIFKNGGEVK